MTVLDPGIAAADPVARALEVASHPLGRPERRLGISQVGGGERRVLAEQRLTAGALGARPIGWLGTLADFVVGRAAQSELSSDVGIRTLSLHLRVGERGLLGAGRVVADAQVIEVGAETVLVAGRIDSEAGGFVAQVTGRFAVVPAMPDVSLGDGAESAVPEVDSLSDLLGAEVSARMPGMSVLTLQPAMWMSNPFGIVHGGILVALADLALVDAATVAAGSVRTLGLDVVFHRPATIGVVPLSAVAVVERVGARVAVLNVSVYQSDPERPVVTATCTMLRTEDHDDAIH